ncbi:MAG TPA: pilus assembly protein PilM [Casimicrobiaceae bacterium]|jgi:general secretion pathway protein L
MPAERDLALPTPSARWRNFARRQGLVGFWGWWGRELATLVPAGPRAAVQRRRMRPVLALDGDRASLWQAVLNDGRLTMVETASFSLSGDPLAVAAEGRAALAKAIARAPSASALGPKIVISLASRATLRKTLILPAAVENDLRQALTYDLDRHTPFKPDDVYFDATVLERDNARGQIRVEMAAARRSQVDAAVSRAESFGATVAAVVPEPPSSASASRLNLLPHELRQNGVWWKRWQFWLPIALLIGIALVAVALPVWQKREYVIALNDVSTQAFQAAAISESLRAQLDRQVGDYNFALERKYAYPSTVQVLDDVTHLLPDDTWLTQLEIKTNGRGKEAQHDLLIRGESANAGRLVTLLEDSHMFTQAAPRSPTTKIQPGPGEIFDLGAQLKPMAPPPPMAVAMTEKAPAESIPPSIPTSAPKPPPQSNRESAAPIVPMQSPPSVPPGMPPPAVAPAPGSAPPPINPSPPSAAPSPEAAKAPMAPLGANAPPPPPGGKS